MASSKRAGLGEEIGDLIGATSPLHGLARLGRARHVAARLAALADEVDGDLVAARAVYANAIADRESEALEKVSGHFEVLGANLLAACGRAGRSGRGSGPLPVLRALFFIRTDGGACPRPAEPCVLLLIARAYGATASIAFSIPGWPGGLADEKYTLGRHRKDASK